MSALPPIVRFTLARQPGAQYFCHVFDRLNATVSRGYCREDAIALVHWLNDRDHGYILTHFRLRDKVLA